MLRVSYFLILEALARKAEAFFPDGFGLSFLKAVSRLNQYGAPENQTPSNINPPIVLLWDQKHI